MRRAPTLSVGIGVRPGSTPSPYARLVLDACDRVPAGQVATYGDVAEWTGRGSARSVGMVLRQHGHQVAWWRIVQASGRPAEPHLSDALRRLRAEGCPVAGEKVVLDRCRWAG